jgi:chaperonin cofactor prefoldin
MDRLERLRERLQRMNSEFERHSESLFAIQGTLREIDGLKKEIENLNDKAGFLFPDGELIRARDALQKRLNRLLKKLEETAKP